jgi:hypothetical protein
MGGASIQVDRETGEQGGKQENKETGKQVKQDLSTCLLVSVSTSLPQFRPTSGK